jgi:hypothetical protein
MTTTDTRTSTVGSGLGSGCFPFFALFADIDTACGSRFDGVLCAGPSTSRGVARPCQCRARRTRKSSTCPCTPRRRCAPAGDQVNCSATPLDCRAESVTSTVPGARQWAPSTAATHARWSSQPSVNVPADSHFSSRSISRYVVGSPICRFLVAGYRSWWRGPPLHARAWPSPRWPRSAGSPARRITRRQQAAQRQSCGQRLHRSASGRLHQRCQDQPSLRQAAQWRTDDVVNNRELSGDTTGR